MNIAITGSSGNIGGMVARHLNTCGLSLILPLRNPAKAPDLPNCEARRFAYSDLELAKQALNGGGRAVYGVCRRKPDARTRTFDFGAGCFGSGRATHYLSLFCAGGVE